MDMTEKKAFRKSFIGGFSREDVNKYIEESTQKYTARIKELEEALLAATSERDELSGKLENAKTELSSLPGLKEKLEVIQLELEEKRSALSEREGQLSSLSVQNRELSERVAALSSIESEYLAKRAELADIEISARERAGKIVADAESEAGTRREALSEELYLRRREFEEKREEAKREVTDAFSGITRLVDSLKGEVDSMDIRISRIADSAKNNVSCLSAAISDAQEKISKISNTLSDNNN